MPEAQPLQPQDPRRLGAYELVGRLGSGGQGTVFLGAGPGGERVAVKLLRVRFDDDETARARFVREASVARQVARFCTAQVMDADVAGDNPYLVSEYVPGPSLSRQVAAAGPITGGTLERLAVNTASALAAIHRAGIVHRDLKPHNVLLGPDGPRVIDFGLSRVLDAASAVSSRPVGTPAYMAPEQVTGDEVGAPADVFAWGATMTFAATGRPPFGADSITAVIYRILHHEPDLGDLDGDLRALVAAALAKDPAERPTAAQVLLRLVGHDDAFAPSAASGPAEVPEEPENAAPDPLLSAGAPAAPAEETAGGAGGAGPAEKGSTESTRPGTGSRGGRRRRRRGRLPAVLAAAAIAVAAGGATYGVMALTSGERGRGAPVAHPSGNGPAGSGTPAATASERSRPAADPARSRTPAGTPDGGRPSGAPGQGGGGPAPTGGTGGGGDDPPGGGRPDPEPVVLGSPDPQRYCDASGDFTADFRAGEWYCDPKGVGVDTHITMTQVCRSQYAPDAEARLGGSAGTPGDWDCYVVK
ncbi:serine/threonine-protein kinase [Actinomadura sp. 21ATH]|uniref:serine/threonine-protein kinase n=1 Tax=Actinomadura sp. 21ATH TaxID=1735444 RepID=UPI0035C1E0D2